MKSHRQAKITSITITNQIIITKSLLLGGIKPWELTWAFLCICTYVHASLRDVPAKTVGANGTLQLVIL